MKTWKKLLALLMVLVMVFAMAACDKDEDDDKKKNSDTSSDEEETSDIVGKWSLELDLINMMNEKMKAQYNGFKGVDSEFPAKFTFKFDDDGEATITLSVDQDDLDSFKDDCVDALYEYFVAQYAAQGKTAADLDAESKAQTGMSYKDYMDSQLSESFKEDKFYNKSEGYYKVEDDTIYFDKDEDNLEDVDDAKTAMEFTLKNDKLTIKDIDSEDDSFTQQLEQYGLELPWKFEKD